MTQSVIVEIVGWDYIHYTVSVDFAWRFGMYASAAEEIHGMVEKIRLRTFAKPPPQI